MFLKRSKENVNKMVHFYGTFLKRSKENVNKNSFKNNLGFPPPQLMTPFYPQPNKLWVKGPHTCNQSAMFWSCLWPTFHYLSLPWDFSTLTYLKKWNHFGKHGKWTGKTDIIKQNYGNLPDSWRSMHSYTLTYSRLKGRTFQSSGFSS